MKTLVILALFTATTAHAILTRKQARQQAQAEDQAVERPTKRNPNRAKEGDKCNSDYDCRLDQFCRKAGFKYDGVCVDKN